MKLYTYDPAPNPRRLTLFMQYKGISLDSQQIDLRAWYDRAKAELGL